MKLTSKIVVLWGLLCLCLVSGALADQIPNRPQNYVVDLARVIDGNTETKLNRYLRELEQKTTAQIVVLSIQSLEGASIEDLSLSIAHDKWKLGQRGKDNGALLLVAVKDRKYRIEVGYGLEGLLPDSLVGGIGRKLLVPHFRKGDYGRGIYQTVLAMANIIAKDAGVTISGMPQMQRLPVSAKAEPPGFISRIFSILFIIFIIYMFIRHPRLFLFFLLMSSMGGRGSSWSSGGGGGFGGGGGGFGGGGASGGW